MAQKLAKYIYMLPQQGLGLADLVGTKASTLSKLTELAVNILPGFVVSGSAFDDFLQENNLVDKMLDFLDQLADSSYEEDWQKISAGIINLLAQGSFNTQLKREISSAYEKLVLTASSFVQVSPSPLTAELSVNTSWQVSYNNVKGVEEVCEYIHKVWLDLFSYTAIAHRQQIQYEGGLSQPVLVQILPTAEVSGVVYGEDITTGSNDMLTVVANLGLLPTSKQWQTDQSDFFLLLKGNGKLQVQVSNSQKFMLVKSSRSSDSPYTEVKVSKLWSERPKLSEQQLTTLFHIDQHLDSFKAGRYQWQWFIEGGQIFLQSYDTIISLPDAELAKFSWPSGVLPSVPGRVAVTDLATGAQTLVEEPVVEQSIEHSIDQVIEEQSITPQDEVIITPAAATPISAVTNVIELDPSPKDGKDIVTPEPEKMKKAEAVMQMLPEIKLATEVWSALNRPPSEIKVLLNNLDGIGPISIVDVAKVLGVESELINLQKTKSLQKKICEYLASYLVACSPKPMLINMLNELEFAGQIQVLTQLRNLYGHRNFWVAIPPQQSIEQIALYKKEILSSGFRRTASFKLLYTLAQPLYLSSFESLQELGIDGVVIDVTALLRNSLGGLSSAKTSSLDPDSLHLFKQFLLQAISGKNNKLKIAHYWQLSDPEQATLLIDDLIEEGATGLLYKDTDVYEFRQKVADLENHMLTKSLRKIKRSGAK